MEELRRPLFFLGAACLLLVIPIELAMSDLLALVFKNGEQPETPGLGIRYLALLDGMLFWPVLVMGLGVLLPKREVSQVQSIAIVVLSFFGFLAAVGLAFLALGLLMLMV